jgi:DNA-binding winged helix-turn-helix (wHTH) protein
LLYSFEDFVLDTEQRELRRGLRLIAVQPQVFDLLAFLIANRHRVVGKDDLIGAVWDGRIVSESALTTRINAARTAISDSGDEQRLIRTLPRKGIRFVGAVRATQKSVNEPAASMSTRTVGSAASSATATPPLSIVVLPFINIGGHAEQDILSTASPKA